VRMLSLGNAVSMPIGFYPRVRRDFRLVVVENSFQSQINANSKEFIPLNMAARCTKN